MGCVWGGVQEAGCGIEAEGSGGGGKWGMERAGAGGAWGAQVRAHAVFALVVLGRDAISLLDRTAHLQRRTFRMDTRGRVGTCEQDAA